VDVKYRFNGFTVDPVRRLLFDADGEPLALKPRVFDVLLFLLEHRGDLLEKQTLLDAVWPNVVVEENNLNQAISTLRRVFGETRGQNSFIVTEPGRGYRFVAPVDVTAEQPPVPNPSGTPAVSTVSQPQSEPRVEPGPARARRGALLRGASVLMAIAAFAVAWSTLRPVSEAPAGDESVAPASAMPVQAAGVLPSSVAVLPFENLSPDPADAYFATALHAEIINQLVKLRSLNVIRAASVVQYAGSGRPLEEIARELNVATVLEATVAYADERIALNATLTDAASRRLLWSERYDRRLEDAFGIQVDIAQQLARQLANELVPAQSVGVERRPTESPEAYALFLQAVSMGGRENTNVKAIELLTAAIALDGDFGEALSWRARLYAASVIDNTTGDSVSAALRPHYDRLARIDAERALELDETNVYALAALTQLDVSSWRWASARSRLERVRDADPGTWLLPIYSFYVGEKLAAVDSARRAVELSPNEWLAHRNLAWVLRLDGDIEGARDALLKGIERAPDRPILRRWLAYVSLAGGDAATALQEIRIAEQLLGQERPRLALAEIAKVYGQLGRAEDARRLFDEIMSAGDPEDLGAGTLAAAYLGVGDTEQALASLHAAAEKVRNHEPDAGFWSLMHLVHDITSHPMLAQPAFSEALSRIRGD
jgi:TolB-like protein/DNA-binding winged helix-turn-helix (wHTH) protein/Flp pilus assembly protein TadD